MEIILNSAKHLENLVEDALDMSRFENNKFQINYQYFNIRKAIKEITKIMKVQIQQKNLKLIVEISDDIPNYIMSD